ncbi:MAG: hypothetical protein F2840_06615 [Actinobacteria bacterium]|uniref:Unannotated protein n=1 Tax=freshwater metagenome TaxID=449393 RepID=A0A6J7JYR9_9ZZZZ|nr:hypothetical protein [Actinomycetota bacterium]
MTETRTGRVEYGSRAFEQDAGHAIRGDVVRALIELITNSDDAYGDSPGEIVIRLAPTGKADYPVSVSVHDSAKGLDAQGLIANFGVLGAEKDQSEAGAHVRGLLGRGAKDVASLGPVMFEAVRDGFYSCFELAQDGSWELTADTLAIDDDICDEMRIEPGQNGLTATVHVAKKFSVPNRATLLTKLGTNAQLRDLAARRPIMVQDARTDLTTKRVEPQVASGEVVIDKGIELQGYSPVHLTVYRMPIKANGTVTPYSLHGLLIKSDVSVFENTWFGLDQRPESAFFCGVIDAPQISTIIRAYDAKDGDLGGPVRLLSRDRDGLVKEHPYRKELARAVMLEVQPLFDALAKQMDAGRKQGASLEKAFKVARDALRDQLTAMMSEIEDDTPGGIGPKAAEALVIIPPVRILQPGESVVLTARAVDEPSVQGAVTIESPSGDDVLAAVECESDWVAHTRLPAFQTQIGVTAGLTTGSADVKLEIPGHVARARILVVAPEEVDAPSLPEGLEVLPLRASVAPGRGKRLNVRAPIEYVGEELIVGASGVPLADVNGAVALAPEPGGRWASATVSLKAGSEKGEAKVRVELPGVGDKTATVVVDEAAGRGGMDFSIDLIAHKSPNRRVRVGGDAGMLEITVYGLHPSFAGVFGKYSDVNAKFADEDSPQARAVLAEVVALALATYGTEREYERRPEMLSDATRVLLRTAERAALFQATLHRALAPAE